MIRVVLFILMAGSLLAQAPPNEERAALQESLGEVGSSQVDFIRALEKHLAKYPKSEQRAELERAVLKAAMEIKDQRRTIIYGEKALATDPSNFEVLERVSRYLLMDDDKEKAKRADYAYVNTGSLAELDEFVGSVVEDLTS